MTTERRSNERKGRPRPLRGLLRDRNSPLGKIAEHARQLNGLQRKLERAAPEAARGHWRIAGVDAEALVLEVDVPAWAAALRYRQGALLDAVAEVIGLRPKRSRIGIEPPRLSRGRPPATLSSTAAEHLRRGATSAADPQLAAALQRLASRSGKD